MARADLTRLERSSATSAEAGRSLAYRLGYVDLVTVAVERATWAAMTTDLAELMAFVAEERCQVFFAHRGLQLGDEIRQQRLRCDSISSGRRTVTPVSDDEFDELLKSGFARQAVHLEMRDAYGTAVELPHMAQWAAGEPDDLAWLAGWCSTLREHARAGRSVRRARIVSEPLSDYQRWSYSIAHPMVQAGEDIRWVPRRLVSSVVLPGNDFYLFDDHLAVFLLYAGNGLAAGKMSSADPADLRSCRLAFEAAWKLAIPHGEYAVV